MAGSGRSWRPPAGVHRGTDVLKMLMAGASVTMVASALYKYGIPHLAVIEREMREWMEGVSMNPSSSCGGA